MRERASARPPTHPAPAGRFHRDPWHERARSGASRGQRLPQRRARAASASTVQRTAAPGGGQLGRAVIAPDSCMQCVLYAMPSRLFRLALGRAGSTPVRKQLAPPLSMQTDRGSFNI